MNDKQPLKYEDLKGTGQVGLWYLITLFPGLSIPYGCFMALRDINCQEYLYYLEGIVFGIVFGLFFIKIIRVVGEWLFDTIERYSKNHRKFNVNIGYIVIYIFIIMLIILSQLLGYQITKYVYLTIV